MNNAQLSGGLVFAEVGRYLARLDELGAQDVLDLSAVTHVDSAGLSLLLELTRRSQRRGRTLRLSKAPAQLRELAKFFKLDPVLKLES